LDEIDFFVFPFCLGGKLAHGFCSGNIWVKPIEHSGKEKSRKRVFELKLKPNLSVA
jgi:hypothetical protein